MKTSIPVCPYCLNPSVLVSGRAVYPHRSDLEHLRFYKCSPCDAYVGCHPGSTIALGRLANAELRKAKRAAHEAFDPLWQDGGLSRRKAYLVLSWLLQMNPSKTHMGLMDLKALNRVASVCEKRGRFTNEDYQLALTWARCKYPLRKRVTVG